MSAGLYFFLEAFAEYLFPFVFQLPEARCPFLHPQGQQSHIFLTSVSSVPPPLAQLSLLPSPHFEGACDYTGFTWTVHGILPILGSGWLATVIPPAKSLSMQVYAFLRIAGLPTTVRMYRPLFDKGRLDCVQLLAVLSRAVMDICVQIFVQIEVFVLWNRCPKLQWLGYVEIACSVL